MKTLLQDGNLEVKKVGGITVTKKVEIIKLTIDLFTLSRVKRYIFSQVGGKIELSTKTKASVAGVADDNTKTQIGRLTKTVSSSGKVGLSTVS